MTPVRLPMRVLEIAEGLAMLARQHEISRVGRQVERTCTEAIELFVHESLNCTYPELVRRERQVAVAADSEETLADDDGVPWTHRVLKGRCNGRVDAVDAPDDLDAPRGPTFRDAASKRQHLPHGHALADDILTRGSHLAGHEDRFGARDEDGVARPELDVLRERALEILQVDADDVGILGILCALDRRRVRRRRPVRSTGGSRRRYRRARWSNRPSPAPR